ncbi:hypothetical protein EJ05DRAFT_534651 [Pseudovirgaria hyperparasitica]|uniref:Phospholipid/glycerol acyltransferase domain-containing protein n=1 Tax=Pseudovirgaria hyperparasitica TaxID=470096 RepID=A0A6A6WM41_9PEZI|nr:uncharacterized protein EJ05DRAFT_534651 [Pseudovirgaria hyperparasitica]KAF2763274.1 hypothetical protein EJ05DRAFT_534651 [Pseudovirgaria hyperparasitica]
MEKFSQYRDRGSGIAPFFPVPTESSGIALPFHIFLFLVRVPLLLATFILYYFALSWLPLGSLLKKGILWVMIGIPGIWWIDLQIDGVRRGQLGKAPANRLPGPRTIIASSYTSPLDCLYLAAIFDPVFTVSWPNTLKVQRISLAQAMIRAFSSPEMSPPPKARLTDLATLLKENPDSPIVVFPECTTTNGRGILPFSPSLLTAPPNTKIFPLNLRYTPGDVATPLPGTYLSFLWNLCSKPTHCIRTRIAECVYNTSKSPSNGVRPPQLKPNSIDTNFFDGLNLGDKASSSETLVGSEELGIDGLNADERKVLDRIGEDLARLGRVKRVGLGVKEKEEFVKAWTKKRH